LLGDIAHIPDMLPPDPIAGDGVAAVETANRSNGAFGIWVSAARRHVVNRGTVRSTLLEVAAWAELSDSSRLWR
jgi:hypothetical protein